MDDKTTNFDIKKTVRWKANTTLLLANARLQARGNLTSAKQEINDFC